MKNKIVFLFFFILLCLGLNIFRDYGVHWDEYFNQDFGSRWTNYIGTVAHAGSLSVPLPTYIEHDLIHGPIFEILLTSLTKISGLNDSRDIIFIRHLIIFFLFYIGSIFFYLLCRRHFRNSWLALMGCLFLVLSPRIFADAFYNPVDIPFLSIFIIGILTLLILLDKRTLLSGVIHAFVCAVLIDIRLFGIFFAILTVIFFFLDSWLKRSTRRGSQDIKVFAGYIFLLIIFTILFNPYLWTNPFGNFINSIIQSINFKNFGYHLHYLGRNFYTGDSLPWHYALVWVAISTPLTYLFLFFTGIFYSVKLFLKNDFDSYIIRRNAAVFLVCFFTPLILGSGKLYNGWRHIYFIYPMLLILAIMGFQYVWQNVRIFFRGLLIVALIFESLNTVSFMIRNHPYQNIYFNPLAGTNADDIIKRFDLDYWGLSYRKALEYILNTDKGDVIPICVLPEDIHRNLINILPPQGRNRIVFTSYKEAKYFLTNFIVNPRKHTNQEYYAINIDGLMIMVVYKLNNRGR